MNGPQVSVGMPVYNNADTIARTLDRFCSQQHRHLEIIISDDCSSDGTEAICRDLARQDARIRYFRQKRNIGSLANHKFVFDLSGGDYFMWCNGHDFPGANYLSCCVQSLEADPSLVLCGGKTQRFDVEGNLRELNAELEDRIRTRTSLLEQANAELDKSGKFAELSAPYEGFHNMVFTEEATVGAFLLRARREGLRDFGACMSPHSAWLILQGIETLSLRMERHMRNTERVVEFLSLHPLVSRVGHPMLPGHPDHALAQKLLPRGAGSVFSFDIKGSRNQGKAFVEALKVFSHLANVGDCRSLVIHPASTTHFRMDDEALARGGISQGTIRLSIGLEEVDDLLDDLKRALRAAEKAGA